MNTMLRSVLGALLALFAAAPQAGVLEEYLRRPDSAYRWDLEETSQGMLATYYFLRLQSQQWLDEQRVDRPVWVHQMRFGQPRPLFCGDTARTSKAAILIISGGNNPKSGRFGTVVPTEAGLFAQAFCRPVIELRQVPNEPLVFRDETEKRREDAIIAYSFDRYLKGQDGDWPVQLAMVRAAVQAMNAIQEFSRTRDDVPDIEEFVVIGASKRGWTAWLTAAMDRRVRAVIPISIDMPSIADQFPHHIASYGQYAPALKEYQAFDIACRMASERGRQLIQIVDPLAYRERLTLPKLILNSAGDQFFVSDSWRFYYDRLLGDNRLRYTVNSDHGHGGQMERYRLIMHARNWVNDVLENREPPRLDWTREPDGRLVIRANRAPRTVKLWTADNAAARDFRLETLGPAWTARTLRPEADGTYVVRLKAPAQGWRAAVAEATFGGAAPFDQQVYTTGVYVVPETLPYAPDLCRPPAQQARAGAGAPVSR